MLCSFSLNHLIHSEKQFVLRVSLFSTSTSISSSSFKDFALSANISEWYLRHLRLCHHTNGSHNQYFNLSLSFSSKVNQWIYSLCVHASSQMLFWDAKHCKLWLISMMLISSQLRTLFGRVNTSNFECG